MSEIDEIIKCGYASVMSHHFLLSLICLLFSSITEKQFVFKVSEKSIQFHPNFSGYKVTFLLDLFWLTKSQKPKNVQLNNRLKWMEEPKHHIGEIATRKCLCNLLLSNFFFCQGAIWLCSAQSPLYSHIW